MPTWVSPTQGGANKAVTPQNCTREVGKPPESPPLLPLPLGLSPILSPPICPQEHFGGSGGSKEGVAGVLGVCRGSVRVCGVFGGALSLKISLGVYGEHWKSGVVWGRWVSIGGPEEICAIWEGTLGVLREVCGRCGGSRKGFAGTLGFWGSLMGVSGMFGGAQDRARAWVCGD